MNVPLELFRLSPCFWASVTCWVKSWRFYRLFLTCLPFTYRSRIFFQDTGASVCFRFLHLYYFWSFCLPISFSPTKIPYLGYTNGTEIKDKLRRNKLYNQLGDFFHNYVNSRYNTIKFQGFISFVTLCYICMPRSIVLRFKSIWWYLVPHYFSKLSSIKR